MSTIVEEGSRKALLHLALARDGALPGNDVVAGLFALASKFLLSPPAIEELQEIAALDVAALPAPVAKAISALRAGPFDLPALAREHTRLFLDPRRAVAEPWESYWHGQPVELMGRIHDSVLAMFREAGFQPRQLENEPADHAGLELAFVALLVSRLGTDEHARALLARFCAAHVDRWIGRFATTFRNTAREPFFVALGDLVLALCGTAEE